MGAAEGLGSEQILILYWIRTNKIRDELDVKIKDKREMRMICGLWLWPPEVRWGH